MPEHPMAFASARAIRDAVAGGRVTARATCEAALQRIAETDPILHAFQQVDADRALARADALDRQDGPPGPLHGVPIALKDNLAARGWRTTAGSRILEEYVSPFDATVVTRLEQAGAVVVGKTVCDEFSMGSSTENSAFGPARNPWAPDRSPGGSSGGSAAAVAAGIRGIPGITAGCRAVRAAGPPPRWPPGTYRSRSGPTRADRSVSRRRSAASWA
jgi:aspartyl-tRNA(Asn)/glutamyl-tRNA(Gln) amidotransferase subunit A